MNVKHLENSFNCDELKHKKRSLVWNFFEKISRERVRCRVCSHEQNYQGTTGNILRHLKARHDLDVTLKGQQDPINQERIKELSFMTKSCMQTMSNSSIDRKPIIMQIRKRSRASESSNSLDPYTENDNNHKESANNDSMFYDHIPELQEDILINNDHLKGQEEHKSARRKKLEEDRIIAETEYFHEKAAYFRMQKHFTALQAKKIKLEIDEFVLNKNLN